MLEAHHSPDCLMQHRMAIEADGQVPDEGHRHRACEQDGADATAMMAKGERYQQPVANRTTLLCLLARSDEAIE